MSGWRTALDLHRHLVADRVRVQRYRAAIESTVRAGDVVLDVGTGSGLLAVLACRAGAARVYAVESTDMIEVASEVCALNGLADRVVFVRGLAEQVELPGPVDVVITETLGNFGIDEGIVGLVADARTRQLKRGGRIVPRSIDVMTAPIEIPDAYAQVIDVWTAACHGVDFSGVRSLAANTLQSVLFETTRCLAAPARLAHVSLLDAADTDVHGDLRWTAERAGTLHGLGGWFTAQLTADVVLSNAPPIATPNWAHAFLPLEHPVPVARGEEIRAAVSARANGSVWYWHVAVGAREVSAQSSLFGTPGLRARVRQGAPGVSRPAD